MYCKLLTTLAVTCSLTAHADRLNICTRNLSLVVSADEGRQPEYVYFGSRLSDAESRALPVPRGGRMDAYPAYGLNCPAPAALACRHADGNLSTQLVVTGTSQQGDLTTVRLKDPVYDLRVDLKYRALADVDMIEAWAEITNGEKATVTLTGFASATLPIRRGDVWMSHLYGSWGNEGRVAEEPLRPGEIVVANRDGVRNSATAHAELMFSLDGKARAPSPTTATTTTSWPASTSKTPSTTCAAARPSPRPAWPSPSRARAFRARAATSTGGGAGTGSCTATANAWCCSTRGRASTWT